MNILTKSLFLLMWLAFTFAAQWSTNANNNYRPGKNQFLLIVGLIKNHSNLNNSKT